MLRLNQLSLLNQAAEISSQRPVPFGWIRRDGFFSQLFAHLARDLDKTCIILVEVFIEFFANGTRRCWTASASRNGHREVAAPYHRRQNEIAMIWIVSRVDPNVQRLCLAGDRCIDL